MACEDCGRDENRPHTEDCENALHQDGECDSGCRYCAADRRAKVAEDDLLDPSDVLEDIAIDLADGDMDDGDINGVHAMEMAARVTRIAQRLREAKALA